MDNFLPQIPLGCENDFHSVLGIYGALLSLYPNDTKTIVNSYKIIADSYDDNMFYIKCNENNQPEGILFWKESCDDFIGELEGDIELNDYLNGLIVYECVSPFESTVIFLENWANQLSNSVPCWSLFNSQLAPINI